MENYCKEVFIPTVPLSWTGFEFDLKRTLYPLKPCLGMSIDKSPLQLYLEPDWLALGQFYVGCRSCGSALGPLMTCGQKKLKIFSTIPRKSKNLISLEALI